MMLAVAPLVVTAVALAAILGGAGITLFAARRSDGGPESLPGRDIRNLLVGGAAGMIAGIALFFRRGKK